MVNANGISRQLAITDILKDVIIKLGGHFSLGEGRPLRRTVNTPSLLTAHSSAIAIRFYLQMKLASHAYSCLFGTFLCNSTRERQQLRIKQNTVSVWDLLLSGRKDLVNCLYSKTNKVGNFFDL